MGAGREKRDSFDVAVLHKGNNRAKKEMTVHTLKM